MHDNQKLIIKQIKKEIIYPEFKIVFQVKIKISDNLLVFKS